MNLYWSNLLAWSLQIGVVIALCAAPAWPPFRFPVSRARLWYWHTVLVVSLALPLLQPWTKPASETSTVTFSTGPFRLAATPQPAHFVISWPTMALAVLSLGIGFRLLWLGLGLVRLRRYRATAIPMEHADETLTTMHLAIAPQAEILMSENVSSPVTFGLFRPVILLPDRFASLSHEEQASIVCHELIHIRRHDWALALAEELVRAIFWFHPAIWWLLGRIQLTREQVVDQEVIRYTGDRSRYLDALLAIASQRFSADLAPAPLFLKKRHLRQRVESIVSGVPMTKRNLLLPLAAAFTTLPVIVGIAAWQFPLHAAPQEAVDDPGIEVQLGAGKLLHRTGITFPQDARAKHISGTVVVGLTLNDKGEVTDAAAVSGPQELRKPVIQSVLNWHFEREPGSTPDLQIAVHFDAGSASDVERRIALVQAQSGITDPEKFHQWIHEKTGVTFEEWKQRMIDAGPAPLTSPLAGLAKQVAAGPIEGVNLDRLPSALRDKVAQVCGLTATSTLPRADLPAMASCLRGVDDHIRTQGYLEQGKMKLMVGISATQQGDAQTPKAIRVGGNVQAANILQQVRPKYPPEAKQARIQGLVRLTAVIGTDGTVKSLELVSGPPELVDAAEDAVKQWVYKPTLLNGSPVEVITTIDINFTLRQ